MSDDRAAHAFDPLLSGLHVGTLHELHLVATPRRPLHAHEINRIRHAEIAERHEKPLGDGVGKPHIRRDAILEMPGDIESVSALGRGRETEQRLRTDPLE